MFSVFILCLLLFYFWYFYFHFSVRPPQPKTNAPDRPRKPNLQFIKKDNNAFVFNANGIIVWQHRFPDASYLVSGRQKIVESDACFFQPTNVQIPAVGLSLYKYIQNNPKYENIVTFNENSPYTTSHKNVFYFTCWNKHIGNLKICPSGEIFQNQQCVGVSACTDRSNGTLLPYHSDIQKYVECQNGREKIKKCQSDSFFYHDRCVPKNDLNLVCKLHDTVPPFKIDDVTLFECRNNKPIYTKCMPGTKLFETNVCEPSDCVGQPDHTKVALHRRYVGPFHFLPGYKECLNEKVFQTIECPQKWDLSLTKGDNLDILPMVFDKTECTVPTFGENVFAHDHDVIVPIHEFTKDLKNWELSEHYDRSVGYVDTGTGRKRKQLEPGLRIGKQFKLEPACGPDAPLFLPIYDQPGRFYDCRQQQVVSCPPDMFFDGSVCKEEPKNAFKYKNIPIFSFDSLDSESWIAPWDYPPKTRAPLQSCASPEFEYLKQYDICSHPDCVPFAFLSMTPQFSLFLPHQEQAKCKFNVTERHLEKKPANFGYTFWDQKIFPENVNRVEKCNFSQKLKTGHFVWDNTIFATCDPSRPFVFCPSVHTAKLLRENNVYACAPPSTNILRHDTLEWVSYATNEIKRILPPVWDGTPYKFRLNRRDPTVYELPETGFEIAKDSKLNLQVNRPVDLELKYRVTHPPNVAFKYDASNQPSLLSSDSAKAFHVRSEDFTRNSLLFPRYRSESHVMDFSSEYHP